MTDATGKRLAAYRPLPTAAVPPRMSGNAARMAAEAAHATLMADIEREEALRRAAPDEESDPLEETLENPALPHLLAARVTGQLAAEKRDAALATIQSRRAWRRAMFCTFTAAVLLVLFLHGT